MLQIPSVVGWRLAGFVKEWPGNVSNAVPKEQHCVCNDFLGMASDVCRLKGKEEDK